MHKKNYPTLVFFALSLITLNAQSIITEVKIINKSGDTLVGKIKNYPKNGWEHEPKAITFISQKGQEMIYTTKDINGFLITSSNRLYQSAVVDVNNEPIEDGKLRLLNSPNEINNFKLDKTEVFLFVLTKGALNLYEYYDDKNKYHYFINTQNEPIKELSFRRVEVEGKEKRRVFTVDTYKKQLTDAMVDCSFNKDWQNLPYKKDELIKAVSNYNACKGKTNFITSKQEKGNYWAPYLGLACPILVVDEPILKTLHHTDFIKPMVGIGREWNLLRNSNKFYSGLDLFFLHYNFSNKRDYINPNEVEEASYKVTGFRLNASLRYIFTEQPYKIYGRMGFGMGLYFKSDFKYNFYNKDVYSGYRPYYTNNKELRPFIVGLGGIYKNYVAELRYERGGKLSTFKNIRADYLTLYLGYVFKVD